MGLEAVAEGSGGSAPMPVQQPAVPCMPFFDFTVPKTESDPPVPLHLTAGLSAITSTPSDASGTGPSASVPWSTAPGMGMEMSAEPSFSMPLAPSTNDDQFDAWLAMLFPSESVGDEWMDTTWNGAAA